MESVEITCPWKNEDFSLNEIGQYNATRMALVSPDYEQLVIESLCRDYHCDIVVAGCQPFGEVNIYGMHYDPESDPKVSYDRTRLFIAFDFGIDDERVEKIAGYFKKLEEFIGCDTGFPPVVQKAIREGGSKYPNGYLFTLSDRWTTSPVMISAVTCFMRAFSDVSQQGEEGVLGASTTKEFIAEVAKVANGNDKNYLTSANFRTIEELITKDWELVSMEAIDYSETEQQSLHDDTGMMSYCKKSWSNSSANCMPWNIKKQLGLDYDERDDDEDW